MLKILVHRPKDSVVVGILPEKDSRLYRFINFTKGHICLCKFSSIDEAFNDLDKYIKEGKVVNYKILEY